MDAPILGGVLAPVPTPFRDDESPALDALAENLARWSRTALDGVLVLGSNGEATSLCDAEKLSVLSAARAAFPKDKLLLAGTGCDSTRETLALSQEAARLGADAALVLTPCYYKAKMDAAAMRRHYTTLADHAGLPILIYNMPACTGVDLPAETVVDLSAHPNIAGIKDSSGNVPKLAAILRDARPGFRVFAGSGSFLYPSLILGAVGGIMALANIAPGPLAEMLAAVRRGDHAAARRLQLRLIPANAAVTTKFGVAGLKQALDWLGYYGGPPRSPLARLNPDEQKGLRAILVESGILPD